MTYRLWCFICYALVVYLPSWRWKWAQFKLLPYAGDWAYRDDRLRSIASKKEEQ